MFPFLSLPKAVCRYSLPKNTSTVFCEFLPFFYLLIFLKLQCVWTLRATVVYLGFGGGFANFCVSSLQPPMEVVCYCKRLGRKVSQPGVRVTLLFPNSTKILWSMKSSYANRCNFMTTDETLSVEEDCDAAEINWYNKKPAVQTALYHLQMLFFIKKCAFLICNFICLLQHQKTKES